MDESVLRAMAKWPDVPAVCGWLALDRRGNWLIKRETIGNEAVNAFINRNYTHDAQGRWYFQNGPQRVFVNLESTPHVAHTDGTNAFVLQTGDVLTTIDGAWFTEQGQLILKSGEFLAQVDDRDLVECLPMLRMDGDTLDDVRLLAWIDGAGSETLTLDYAGQSIALGRISATEVAGRFGFVKLPQPDPTGTV